MSSTMVTDSVKEAMLQYDQQGCLHEQFMKQAKATPEAVAVVTYDGKKVNNLHSRNRSKLMSLCSNMF
jgi:hypothetical protein